jgi:hypothetical protein
LKGVILIIQRSWGLIEARFEQVDFGIVVMEEKGS